MRGSPPESRRSRRPRDLPRPIPKGAAGRGCGSPLTAAAARPLALFPHRRSRASFPGDAVSTDLAMGEAFDLAVQDLDRLIVRHFVARRTLVVSNDEVKF